MTAEEKRIAHYCRVLRSLAYLAVFNGIAGSIWSLIELFFPQLEIKVFFTFSWALVNIYYGFSLRRLRQWCFYGGIVLYGYGLIMGLVSRHWLAVIISILFLLYIINPVSRNILFKIDKEKLQIPSSK